MHREGSALHEECEPMERRAAVDFTPMQQSQDKTEFLSIMTEAPEGLTARSMSMSSSFVGVSSPPRPIARRKSWSDLLGDSKQALENILFLKGARLAEQGDESSDEEDQIHQEDENGTEAEARALTHEIGQNEEQEEIGHGEIASEQSTRNHATRTEVPVRDLRKARNVENLRVTAHTCKHGHQEESKEDHSDYPPHSNGLKKNDVLKNTQGRRPRQGTGSVTEYETPDEESYESCNEETKFVRGSDSDLEDGTDATYSVSPMSPTSPCGEPGSPLPAPPTVELKACISSEDEESCFICLLPFDDSDDSKPIQLPCANQCNKTNVHDKCIYEWRERRTGEKERAGSCPLCRGSLSDFSYTPPDLLKTHNFCMFSARSTFLRHPVLQNVGMVRCYVRVTPYSWMGQSTYEMYIQAPSTLPYPDGAVPDSNSPKPGDQLLFCARKRSFMFSSRLEMTMDRDGKDYNTKSPQYLGYVSSSFTGLEHTIYSNAPGQPPHEIGVVGYCQNRFGLGIGPRKMRLILPNVKPVEYPEISTDRRDDVKVIRPEEQTVPNQPRRRSETLAAAMSNRQAILANQEVYYMENREPSWIEAIQAYSLDFHGRVLLPSNKNFQLCTLNRNDMGKDKTLLQFGKVVSHEDNGIAVYTLDFCAPLSPLQAFGIALTSCDRKLACA